MEDERIQERQGAASKQPVSAPKRSGKHRLWRRLLLWAFVGFVVYALLGFLVLPYVLKAVLVRQLSAKLQRPATIQEIKVNPFLLTVQINGFSLEERNGTGPFASFDGLFLDLEAASLLKGSPVLREIRLTAPRIRIVRNEDFSYNVSDLLQEFSAKSVSASKSAPSKPVLFSFNNIQLIGGRVDFDDRPKQARHTVTDLTIAVPFISNLPSYGDVFVQPAFQASVNGAPIAFAGKAKPFSDSRETALGLTITHVDIPTYLEYVPVELRFKIPSGTLNASVSLSFFQYDDRPPALLLSGTVALNNLVVTDLNAQPVATFPLVELDVDSVNAFERTAKVTKLFIQSPELRLSRDKTGAFNVKALLPERSPDAGLKEKEKGLQGEAPLRFEIAEIRLTAGKVAFSDESTEKPFRTSLDDIDVQVRNLSNADRTSATIEASLRTSAGEAMMQRGTITLRPLTAEGTIELHRLPVKQYAPYYQKHLLFSVEDGIVDLSTTYRYTAGKGGETMLSGLAATLNSVRLRKNGEAAEFLKIPTLAITRMDIDVVRQSIKIGEVHTTKGNLSVKRERDGTLNLATLLPPPQTSQNEVTPGAPARSGSVPSWLVSVKKIAVHGYSVQVEDRVPPQPVLLVAEPVHLMIDHLSNAKNSKGNMSLRANVNKTGSIAIHGPLSISPVRADLAAELKGLRIAALQPYFTDRIKVLVTDGAVSASGNVRLASYEDGAMAAAFTGRAAVTEFSTVDKVNAEDFLKWASLDLSGIAVGTHPFHLDIQDIALTDFYLRLIVNADGTLNVQGIIEKTSQAPQSSEAKTAAQPPPHSTPSPEDSGTPAEPGSITIGKVTLQGGTVNFSDRYIKPNYSADLTRLAGRVSGLSAEEGRRADVDLRGRLNDHAPLEITGQISPLGQDLFADLRVNFSDIELTPVSPYSAKYAGYTIQKGKLSLSLKYLLVKRKLESDNKVFLDQLTFGEKVDSPDAVKLPVRLAVSLLKDRQGQIHLDVPVSGSLDDPQFSVWGVILTVIKNLLAKAAASPFALLGALVGGEEQLSAVEFEYGRSQLSGPAESRLKALARVLYERPALTVEVAGRVDLIKDREALRRQTFVRKIKAQKLDRLVKKGESAGSLDEITIEPEEYATYLTMAYKKEPFPKPRNIFGAIKALPIPEMESLILTHIVVTEDDLQRLAMQRAQVVKDYLLKAGKIEPERVFLVTAITASENRRDDLKDSRVDFSLKS